ncbi:AAA family ATPase [Paraburkholderia sp. WC7.3b]|uniref:AAA family ATPase n=2 Tax=Burkholderiaceae TaxID=119060 RepID=A0ABR7PFM1_9BURK|nr:AAA family ATPase [Paraburkholderia podalyriae]
MNEAPQPGCGNLSGLWRDKLLPAGPRRLDADAERERALSALQSLDSGCPREEWVRVGMAAKAARLTEEEFLAWSEPAGNFKSERDVRDAWRSFENGRGVSAATLFHMARAAGWYDAQHTRASHLRDGGQSRSSQSTCLPQPKPKAGWTPPPTPSIAEKFARYAPASSDHPYIVAKRGSPDGLRVVPADDEQTIHGVRVAGSLAVPVRSMGGELQTVQYIPEPGVGQKMNTPGASFGDGLFVIGDIGNVIKIYVCEGLGQAWSCNKADPDSAAVVTFGAGRTEKVAELLRARYAAGFIVIVADRGQEEKGETIAQAVGGTMVMMPADKPKNYDANDYEADHGIEALAALLHAVVPTPLRYQLRSAHDLMNAPPQRWLVRGVIPETGFAAVYGQPGSGKSFLVLDLCIAVASGSEWFGRRVMAAPVTYLCLEGDGGIGKRLKAWSMHHEQALPGRLEFITQPFNLRNLEDLDDLCTAVLAAGGQGAMTVIDTLNRAAPGADENSSQDMGNLIGACQEIQRRIGGVVLIVHHTTKLSTGLRGHSSLHGALDAEIEVKRDGDRREWVVAKNKDGDDGEATPFRLHLVDLDEDEYGDPVTSCVLERSESKLTAARPRPRGATQEIVYEALGALLRESKDFGKAGAPTGRPCVEIEAIVQVIAGCLPCRPDQRQYQVRRAITAMTGDKKIYQVNDGWLWAN